MDFKVGDKVMITEQTPGVPESNFDSVGAIGTVMEVRAGGSGCAIEAQCQRTGRIKTFWYSRDDFCSYTQNVDRNDSDAAKRFIDDF